jgi:hypothetical protein
LGYAGNGDHPHGRSRNRLPTGGGADGDARPVSFADAGNVPNAIGRPGLPDARTDRGDCYADADNGADGRPGRRPVGD